METKEIICKNCGLVDDYRTEQAGPHIKAICNGCDQYIKFLPQGGEPTLHFGKFKGRTISSMTKPTEIQYLYWLLGNMMNLSKSTVEPITEHLKKYPR